MPWGELGRLSEHPHAPHGGDALRPGTRELGLLSAGAPRARLCAGGSSSLPVHERVARTDAGVSPVCCLFYLSFYIVFIFIFLQFFHGTAPKPSLSQIHQAIFGFDNEAQSETVCPA